MIGFTMKPEAFIAGFFDRIKVDDAVQKAKLRYKSKAGAFVRRTMKSSIRSSKKTSRPYEPPHGHAEKKLAKFIFFANDAARDSVVIGPAALSMRYDQGDGEPLNGSVPATLEAGGEIQILETEVDGTWQHLSAANRRNNADRPKRFRRVRIEPRPFARPALEAEAPNFPDLIQL